MSKGRLGENIYHFGQLPILLFHYTFVIAIIAKQKCWNDEKPIHSDFSPQK
jgi:hypothetical protein